MRASVLRADLCSVAGAYLSGEGEGSGAPGLEHVTQLLLHQVLHILWPITMDRDVE